MVRELEISDIVLKELAKKYGFKSIEEYARDRVIRAGYLGKRAGESIRIPLSKKEIKIEKDIGPIEEFEKMMELRNELYKEELALEKGFESVEKYEDAMAKDLGISVFQYRKEHPGPFSLRGVNVYSVIIPREEFEEGMRIIRKKWLEGHKKFLDFCDSIKRGILEDIKKSKERKVAAETRAVMDELQKYHVSHPGPMNIFDINDLMTGLHYCFLDKKVEVRLSSDRKYITFKKMS